MSRERRSRLSVQVPGTPALYSNDLPGWDTVGVVRTASGTGALVKNRRTGTYCRANSGVVSSLPQNKVLAAIIKATRDKE